MMVIIATVLNYLYLNGGYNPETTVRGEPRCSLGLMGFLDHLVLADCETPASATQRVARGTEWFNRLLSIQSNSADGNKQDSKRMFTALKSYPNPGSY